MSEYNIPDVLKNGIYNNVINVMLPQLIENEKKELNKYLYGVVQIIYIAYEFYLDSDNYTLKLTQNNYRDLKWLLTYLLPYINQNIKPMSEIRTLNDIYTMKYDDYDADIEKRADELGISDINLKEPRYIFSNIQYGRCFRKNKYIAEINFKWSHIKDNYYLLLDTIINSRYKFHVNWIDVVPYRIDNYKDSNLYQKTINKMANGKIKMVDIYEIYKMNIVYNINTAYNIGKNIDGLNIEDIYNTIRINLYKDTIPVKWLIDDIPISIDNNNIQYPLIQILGFLFDFRQIINNNIWDIIDKKEQIIYEKRWKEILDILELNIEIDTNIFIIPSSSLIYIFKAIIFNLFNDKKIVKKLRQYKNFIQIYTNYNENIDDEYYSNKSIEQLKIEDVIRSLRTIKFKYIYEFFVNTMQKFGNTWYAQKLYNSDKSDILEIDEKKMGGYVEYKENRMLTYKYIFEFCRNFVSYKVEDKHILYEENWKQLNIDSNKKEIVDRLKIKYITPIWFDIKEHIKKNINIFDNELYNENRDIYIKIMEILIDIIFESLIYKGVMSHMTADNNLTNENMYDLSDNENKKKLIDKITILHDWDKKENSKYGKHSYYYLTNKPYGLVKKEYIKIGNNVREYGYFDICMHTDELEYAWYLSLAYCWTAQLGFCHKFIHNRVSYVTASTGAGKSTEMPKLYMYYLKAIDYNNNGTVLVTVPRINVADNISDFVSKCLALPISTYDNTTHKIVKTTNFNIQFRYKSKNHIDDGYYPKIMYVTDGSVIEFMIDPILKKTIVKNNQYIYISENRYDIIVIDEAHEHNINMDLILTFIKNAIYYNNKLRLVIMSATIDEDEPKYRRFYRSINDNRKYPPDSWIEKHTIDRINTDRRFHIAKPDTEQNKTKYKITEYYRPEMTPENMVLEAVRNTSEGDILLFQPGVSSINKSINKLNMLLPDNIIALPYHAKLSSWYKDFIKDIDKNKMLIKIDRSVFIMDQMNVNEDLKKGTRIYNRVVIVSTNIAEASITFKSVNICIDTGIEKNAIYEYKKGSSIFVDNFITESSRIQRRGRVGRTSPGTVYYLYKKGSLVNNSKLYNITTSDLSQNVMLNYIYSMEDKNFRLMISTVNKLIMGGIINQNIKEYTKEELKKFLIDRYKNKYNNLKLTKTEENKIKTFLEKIKTIINMIVSQYTNGNNIYTYYGNNKHYDYINNKNPIVIYESGYEYVTLVDEKGLFYFIHPDEMNIKRNIYGSIVGTKDSNIELKVLDNSLYKKRIISEKIESFWNTLIDNNYIIKKENNMYYKTELGTLLNKFANELSNEIDNYNLIKMLFYGYGILDNKTFNDIMDIVSFLDVIGNNNLNAIFNVDKERKIYESDLLLTVKKIFGSTYDNEKISDIYVILNICKFINNIASSNKIILDIFEFIKKSNIYIDLKSNKTYRNIVLYSKHKEYDNIYLKNIINSKSSMVIMIEKVGISINMFKKYIKKRIKLKRLWSDIYNKVIDSEKPIDINDIKKININEKYKYIITKNNIDKIKGILLLCYPYNIVKKMDSDIKTYISLYSPIPENIVNIKQISRGLYKKPVLSSFVDSIYLHNHLLYQNFDINNGEISILTHITKDELILISQIYRKNIFNVNVEKYYNNKKNLPLYVDKYIKDNKTNNDKIKGQIYAINVIDNVIKNIKDDIDYMHHINVLNS